MAEIDDGRLNTLSALYNLHAKLVATPAGKRAYERMLKEHVEPNLKTTDDEAELYMKPIKDELAEIKKALKERGEKDENSEFFKRFGEVANKFELTKDGEDTLKKFMMDRRIADPEDAYYAWKGREPPKPLMPSGLTPSGWGFGTAGGDAEDDAAMMGDTDNYFDRLASKVWDEVKRDAA